MLSDRLCIRSKGRYNYELSSRYITACDAENYGCDGGYLDLAWDFLEENGTVSGGEFESDEVSDFILLKFSQMFENK